MILDNDDDLDRPRAGGQAEGVSGKVGAGRIALNVGLHNSLPTSELASAPTESIASSCMTLGRAAISRRQPRDLGLTSSTSCLLLLHKLNQCKVRAASKVSAVSLDARGWSLRTTHSLPKSSDSSDDGQMRTC